jgi:hypothetical protein
MACQPPHYHFRRIPSCTRLIGTDKSACRKQLCLLNECTVYFAFIESQLT